MQAQSTGSSVKVWDLPTRSFHWILVALVVASYVSAKAGKIEWHVLSGKLILTLVLFRIAWGFVGGRYARFANFLRGPGAALGYLCATLKGTAKRHLGHNPIGAWSVLAMLLVVLTQAVTGLFATDDIYTDGPLRHLVSGATAGLLTTIHRVGINLLIALVVLHVLAIFYYGIVKKDNLARAMVTGAKTLAPGEAPPPRGPDAVGPDGSLALALTIFAVVAAIVFGGLAVFGK